MNFKEITPHYIKERFKRSLLVKDSLWALSGNAIGRGLSLAASILVARLLGKDLFGAYGLIRTTLLTIAIFSSFGLGYTATKFIADYVVSAPNKIRGVIDNIFKITIATSCTIAIIIFACSHQVASLLGDPTIYTSLRYLSAIIIFNAITTTQTGILSGFKKFKELARINTINGSVTFFLSAALTYLYGLNGALTALLISQIYNCVQNLIEVRRSLAPYPAEKHNNIKEIFNFSLPVAMQEFILSAAAWVIPVLIVRLYSIGEVGIYNASMQWAAVILFIPATLSNVTLSHVSSLSGYLSKQVALTKKMLTLNFTSTFILFAIIFCAATHIEKLYGESFEGMSTVLCICVLMSLPNSMTNALEQYFIARNNTMLILINRITREVVAITIFLLLFKFCNHIQGAISISIAMLISRFVGFVIFYCLFRRSYTNN